VLPYVLKNGGRNSSLSNLDWSIISQIDLILHQSPNPNQMNKPIDSYHDHQNDDDDDDALRPFLWLTTITQNLES